MDDTHRQSTMNRTNLRDIITNDDATMTSDMAYWKARNDFLPLKSSNPIPQTRLSSPLI